ncbi:Ubiquitin-conjugating enzyme E2 11 [Pelomyxa schiedti]|nr:Ubiquitin-conjugating enzyme E2 11 [Pelomyxa schiedti]
MASDASMSSGADATQRSNVVVHYNCFWLRESTFRKVSLSVEQQQNQGNGGRGPTVRDLRDAIHRDLIEAYASATASRPFPAKHPRLSTSTSTPTSTSSSTASAASAASGSSLADCVDVVNSQVELALVNGDGGVVVVDGPLADVRTLEECGVDVSRLTRPACEGGSAASAQPQEQQVSAYAWLCCDKVRDSSPIKIKNAATRNDVIRVSTKYPIPGATYKVQAQNVERSTASNKTKSIGQTQPGIKFYFNIKLDLSKDTAGTLKKEIERVTGIPVPMQTLMCKKRALSQGNLSESGITSCSHINLSVDEGSLHRFAHCTAYQPFQSAQTLPGMAQFLSCLYTLASHFSSRLSDFASWSLASNDALFFPPAWIGLRYLVDQGVISYTLKSAISCYFWEIFRQIVPKTLENGSDKNVFEHSITCFGILLQGTSPNTQCPFVKESLLCSKSFERVFDPVMSTKRPLNRTSIAIEAQRQCAMADKQTLALLVVSRQKPLQVIIWKLHGTSVGTQEISQVATNRIHKSILSIVRSVQEAPWESVLKNRTSFTALHLVAPLNLTTAKTPCITLDENASHSVCLGPQHCGVVHPPLQILAKTLGTTKRDVIVDEREVKEAVIVALDTSSSMISRSFSFVDDQIASPPPLLIIPVPEAQRKIEKLCQSRNGHYLQKILKSRGNSSKILYEVSCFSHKWKSIMTVKENRIFLLNKLNGPKCPTFKKEVMHPESKRRNFHEGERVNITAERRGMPAVQFQIDAYSSVRALELKLWLKTGLEPSRFTLWKGLHICGDGISVGNALRSCDIVGQHCVRSVDKALTLKFQMDSRSSYKPESRMTRLDIVKQLFNAFVNRSVAYNYPVQIGLVLFSDNASLECGITPLFEEFRCHVESARSRGNTALYSAINLAASTLNTFAKIRPNCIKRILCLTDGEDTCSKELPHEIANLLQTSKIVLDSVMICEGDKNHALHAVCKATGGLSFVPQSLKDALKLVELETIIFSEMRPPRTEAPLVTSQAGLDSYKNQPKDLCNEQTVPKHQLPSMLSHPCSTIASTLSGRQATESTAAEPDSARPKDQVQRILSELAGIQRDHDHQDYHVFPCLEDVGFWRIIMRGPPSSPYSGGSWLLYASFPADYPLSSPEVRVVTPIVHCNISPYGRICHPIFGRNWTSDTTMQTVLDSIYELLLFPQTQDPLDSILAYQFFTNKTAYEQSIRNHILSVPEARKSMDQWVEELSTIIPKKERDET